MPTFYYNIITVDENVTRRRRFRQLSSHTRRPTTFELTRNLWRDPSLASCSGPRGSSTERRRRVFHVRLVIRTIHGVMLACLSVCPPVRIKYTSQSTHLFMVFFFLYFVSFFLSRHPRRSPYTLGAEDAAVSVRRRRRRRREHSHVLCKRDEIYPGLISITKIPLVVAIRLRHLARSGRIPNLPSRVLLLKHDGPRPSERVR